MDNKYKPKISVIMPVFNGSKWVEPAINSVLNQSFTDFELIIVDDQSKDDSICKIQGFLDHRIRLISLQRNLGLPKVLNLAITQANGTYIARLDQDDLMHSKRLEVQSSYLDANLDCALVGSWADIITEDGKRIGSHRHPTCNGAIQLQLLFDNPFVHSSVLMRKSSVMDVGLYCVDDIKQPPEDYELWSRLSRKYALKNLSEVLTYYREVQGSLSRKKSTLIRENVINISADNLFHILHKNFSKSDCKILAQIMHRKSLNSDISYPQITRILFYTGSLIYKDNKADYFHILSTLIKIWLKITIFFLIKK
jgi:glycosyltransferase involved in cell wall biosynthesis